MLALWHKLQASTELLRLALKRPLRVREARCKTLAGVASMARQEVLTGWDQAAVERSVIANIGAGGAGGELAFAQVRKGYACIHMFDADIVEPSNLNRQFFDHANVGQNKAHAIVKRLRGEGFRGSRLVGHPYYYDQLLDAYIASLRPDVITVCIDQLLPGSRADASRLARLINVPAVFVAISDDADWGYVFVQDSDPDQACWGCVIHSAEVSDRKRCPGTVGATIDPLKMLAGIASYAIDSLVMNRPRDWNYRAISLSRSGMFFSTNAPRRPDCALCGKDSA